MLHRTSLKVDLTTSRVCRNPCENTRLAGRQPKSINTSGTDLCELIFDQDNLGSTQGGRKPVAMVSNNTPQQCCVS